MWNKLEDLCSCIFVIEVKMMWQTIFITEGMMWYGSQERNKLSRLAPAHLSLKYKNDVADHFYHRRLDVVRNKLSRLGFGITLRQRDLVGNQKRMLSVKIIYAYSSGEYVPNIL